MYPPGATAWKYGASSRAQVDIVRGAVFTLIVSAGVVVERSFSESAPFFTQVPLRLLEKLLFPEKFPDRSRCSLQAVVSNRLPLRAEVIEYGF